jgi:hypothetical protein
VCLISPIIALASNVGVFESQTGFVPFTLFNTGPAATISGIDVVQESTQGDVTDFANKTGLGGTCVVGSVIAADGSCTVEVNFVTDTADFGPFNDGVTPFDLTFNVDDGRSATAQSLVSVSDAPEPTSLALLASALGTLLILGRRIRSETASTG